MYCLFTKLASSVFNFILLLFAFYLYFDIFFDKVIREMSFATFDVTLYCLLRKKARV